MKLFLALILILSAPSLVQAAAGDEAVTVEKVRLLSRVKPGARVTAAVDINIKKGFHTHSNKPSESFYIATELKVTAKEGAKVLSVKYPKGESKKIKDVEKPLSIYEDEFTARVLIHLDAKAKLPLTLPASIRYQACKGKVCYRPQTLKFDITLPAAK